MEQRDGFVPIADTEAADREKGQLADASGRANAEHNGVQAFDRPGNAGKILDPSLEDAGSGDRDALIFGLEENSLRVRIKSQQAFVRFVRLQLVSAFPKTTREVLGADRVGIVRVDDCIWAAGNHLPEELIHANHSCFPAVGRAQAEFDVEGSRKPTPAT
jgi:hypothetical protein